MLPGCRPLSCQATKLITAPTASEAWKRRSRRLPCGSRSAICSTPAGQEGESVSCCSHTARLGGEQ